MDEIHGKTYGRGIDYDIEDADLSEAFTPQAKKDFNDPDTCWNCGEYHDETGHNADGTCQAFIPKHEG